MTSKKSTLKKLTLPYSRELHPGYDYVEGDIILNKIEGLTGKEREDFIKEEESKNPKEFAILREFNPFVFHPELLTKEELEKIYGYNPETLEAVLTTAGYI
jgi:hypothetical protein